ncbi:MAG: hypothetical protein ACK5Y2_13245 [Bdellovibrionales bacterium]
MIENKSGQSTLEGLLVLPLGLVTVSLLVLTASVSASYFWARYQLYEAVICLQDEDPWACKSQFHRKMRSVTSYVRVQSLDLSKTPHLYRGHCRLGVSFLGRSVLEITKQIPR